jgi:hypothetical protein
LDRDEIAARFTDPQIVVESLAILGLSSFLSITKTSRRTGIRNADPNDKRLVFRQCDFRFANIPP